MAEKIGIFKWREKQEIIYETYVKYMKQKPLQGRHIAGKKIGKHAKEEFGPGRGEFIFKFN